MLAYRNDVALNSDGIMKISAISQEFTIFIRILCARARFCRC